MAGQELMYVEAYEGTQARVGMDFFADG